MISVPEITEEETVLQEDFFANKTPENPASVPAEHIAERRAAAGFARETEEAPRAKTPFTESLDALKTSDFQRQPKKRKHRRGFTVTQWVALGLCFAVLAFSGYKVVANLFEYAEAQKQYNELWNVFYAASSGGDYLPESATAAATPTLLSSMESPVEDASAAQSELMAGLGEEESYQVIMARLEKLKSLNADTYGWLRVTGTGIDYPVVKGADNDFYLRRGFYKSFLSSGSIFADAACGAPADNRNTVLYGHNMKDGTMFHTLHNLKNKSYFDNAEIQLMTTEGIYIYEVYSVHTPHESDIFFHTSFSDAGWQGFLDWTHSDSMYLRQDVTLSPADKVITLSTCTTTTTEEPYRFVAHGKLVQVLTS